jgi:hypothetical protein
MRLLPLPDAGSLLYDLGGFRMFIFFHAFSFFASGARSKLCTIGLLTQTPVFSVLSA